MPSSFSKRLSKTFRRASVSSTLTRASSFFSLYDRRDTFSSDAGALDSEFPNANPAPKVEVIEENEAHDMDFEDQAWGPPPSNFKMPSFLRRRK